MSWFVLALIVAFLFGATNFIDRFLVEKRIPDPFFVSIIGGIAAVVGGFVVMLINGIPAIGWVGATTLLIGGLAAELALVPWYKAIKQDDTSRVVPYLQLIPVVVLGLSYVLLDEQLTRNQLIGFALIIAGGVSLAIERSPKELFRIRKSFWYILISIMLWAPVVVLFKMVAIEQDFWDAIVWEAIGMGMGAIMLWLYAKTKVVEELRAMTVGTWGVVGVNEAAYIAARVLQFSAVMVGPAALVSVVGGIQPLFALIVGLLFSKWFPQIIKEDIKKETVLLKLVAIVIVFAGIVTMNM